jgi:cyclopropane-fatty-acyl-phospholipid synthase
MWTVKLAQTNLLPDWLIRLGVRAGIVHSIRQWYARPIEVRHTEKQRLIEKLHNSPIAIATEQANAQHYEIPPEFFRIILGSRLKYSCCYWPDGVSTIDDAEEAMLQLTCERAQIADGMRILDLGCGWGALTLWVAEHYPNCQLVAVSNSTPQGEYILEQARLKNLKNVSTRTADIRTLECPSQFDRIVSIEMFEHLKNYESLLAKLSSFLVPAGKLFVHIFSHQDRASEFDSDDPDDWMAQTFFTGGIMPSDDLLLHFQRDMHIVDHWILDGTHYARTLNAWLHNIDAHEGQVRRILANVYGKANETLWLANWRLFFIVCSESWGAGLGQGRLIVSHYLFEKHSPTNTG